MENGIFSCVCWWVWGGECKWLYIVGRNRYRRELKIEGIREVNVFKGNFKEFFFL